MSLANALKIYDAYYPLSSEEFIDIKIKDNSGNIFEGLLRLKRNALVEKGEQDE